MRRTAPCLRAGRGHDVRMNALLEMPEVRRRVSPVSVAEYHTMGELNENGRRTELIRGLIIEKMPKSPLHRFFTDRVREILAAQIAPEFMIFSQDPMTTADSEPEPDVMVVRGRAADFRREHPRTAELAVEVAVSSPVLDRAKADIYAEAGVQEYWIVCPEEKRVEVFRQAEPRRYVETLTVCAPAVLASTALPGVQVDLAALFA